MKIVQLVKFLLHCIIVPREYYMVNDKLFVREGFNKPKELMEHLKSDHKLCQAEINDLMLESRKMLEKK